MILRTEGPWNAVSFSPHRLPRQLSPLPARLKLRLRNNLPREFYQLRRYHLISGAQLKLTESYFADALIPALTRIGMGPIGAFSITIGPETPRLLSPHSGLID